MSCVIHKGKLDPETFMPVDKSGNFVLFGYRTCGLRECVNPDHHTLNIRKGKTLTGAKPERLFTRVSTISGEDLHRIAKPLLRFTEPAVCQVPNCGRKHRAANLCSAHHSQWLRWRKDNNIVGRVRQHYDDVLLYVQPPNKGVTMADRYCHVPNCERGFKARGLCSLHLKRFHRVSGAKW